MSATVLRELVAKLGFQVDDAGFKRASAGVDSIKRSVVDVDAKLRDARGRFQQTGAAAGGVAGRMRDAAGRMREANGRFVLGQGKGGGAIKGATSDVLALSGAVGSLQASLMRLGVSFGLGALLKQMTTLASNANETDNVLEQVFGAKGAAQVKAWSETTSKEIGRSRYTLRDYTGQLGAMLEPMLGSATKAQEMSTTLSKLSVDLASFFNTADDDALLALKSGLAGEAEPLRRYGVVLLDATLQEYAHSKGIHTKLTAMTNAQKVELRYQYILAHTTKAQGDAARTADGFANSSRALKDNLKDLGTSIGQKLLPVAGALIKWANLGIEAFRELARKSNIAEGALLAVAAAIAAMNAAAIADMLPALTAMLLLAAAIDEVITTMNGGQSLIRDWIDGWKGVGATDELVGKLKESLKELDANMPDMVTSWHLLEDSIDDVGYAVQQLIGEFTRLLKMPITAPLQWMDKANAKLWSLPGLKQVRSRLEENDKKYLQEHGVANPISGSGSKWYDDTPAPAIANYRGTDASATTSLQGKIEMRRARKGRAYVEDQAARHERVRQRRVKEYEAQSSRSKTQDIQDAGMTLPAAEPSVSAEPPLSLAAPMSSAPAVTNNISNVTINNGDINMSTDSSMSDARRGAQAAQAERRRTADSLKRGG